MLRFNKRSRISFALANPSAPPTPPPPPSGLRRSDAPLVSTLCTDDLLDDSSEIFIDDLIPDEDYEDDDVIEVSVADLEDEDDVNKTIARLPPPPRTPSFTSFTATQKSPSSSVVPARRELWSEPPALLPDLPASRNELPPPAVPVRLASMRAGAFAPKELAKQLPAKLPTPEPVSLAEPQKPLRLPPVSSPPPPHSVAPSVRSIPVAPFPPDSSARIEPRKPTIGWGTALILVGAAAGFGASLLARGLAIPEVPSLGDFAAPAAQPAPAAPEPAAPAAPVHPKALQFDTPLEIRVGPGAAQPAGQPAVSSPIAAAPKPTPAPVVAPPKPAPAPVAAAPVAKPAPPKAEPKPEPARATRSPSTTVTTTALARDTRPAPAPAEMDALVREQLKSVLR